MNSLWFDLDGTLLDVSHRHYAVYCAVLGQWNETPLGFDEYWRAKREGNVPVSQANTEEFKRLWLEWIERRDLLRLDRVLPGARELLGTLGRENKLTLVTLRQSPEALREQLQRLELDRAFSKVLTARGGAEEKARLIRQGGAAPTGWLIGDTEADVMAAKLAGLKSCTVTWGLRSRAFLEKLKPDSLADDFSGVARAVGSAV